MVAGDGGRVGKCGAGASGVRPSDLRRSVGRRKGSDGAEQTVAIRIVRLGSPRVHGEGLRIGTVRRPPRGVPKAEYAARNFYDVWLPNLAPSAGLVGSALRAKDDRSWRVFTRRYRAEMSRPEASRILDLLAALSHVADLSVGCYCQDERRCHRSVMRDLLAERGSSLA